MRTRTRHRKRRGGEIKIDNYKRIQKYDYFRGSMPPPPSESEEIIKDANDFYDFCVEKYKNVDDSKIPTFDFRMMAYLNHKTRTQNNKSSIFELDRRAFRPGATFESLNVPKKKKSFFKRAYNYWFPSRSSGGTRRR